MPAEYDARTNRPIGGDARKPTVVHVTGEIDMEHAGELRDVLMTALDGAKASSEIIVDLSNSSFCDSSGLNALLRVREAALRTGHTLSLAAPSHQMLRLLDLTGSADLFPVRPGITTQ
ncbi:STAS domain-containing protein [Streptomyces sp. NPDC127106]|uniref:STAS domain-containing protein n=1 Tax=Streptomyces sp. NPDC127106 TaxID=3345360 RepID=UPI0036390D35